MDPEHEMLKARLMASFARNGRKSANVCKETKMVRTVLEEETQKQDSRIFKLTRRINGKISQEEEKAQTQEEEKITGDHTT